MFRVDPIEDPNYNPLIYRPANPERMALIFARAKEYERRMGYAAAAREELEEAIREARDAGHSLSQLAEAAGVSISSIQRILGLA